MSSRIIGKKIFILDDDIDFINLMTKILETAGANVISAMDISTAIELFQKVSPHLLLLDLNIEGKEDGFQFVKYLKELPPNKYPSIIIVSAQNDPKTLSKFNKDDIDDFIVKPISSNIVLRKINKLLLTKKTQEILRYNIDANIDFRFQVMAQVTSINEFGCFLEMPVRLTAETPIEVKSNLFNDLEINEVKLISTGNYRSVPDKIFQNEISFIGLDEKKLINIRKLKHIK